MACLLCTTGHSEIAWKGCLPPEGCDRSSVSEPTSVVRFGKLRDAAVIAFKAWRIFIKDYGLEHAFVTISSRRGFHALYHPRYTCSSQHGMTDLGMQVALGK